MAKKLKQILFIFLVLLIPTSIGLFFYIHSLISLIAIKFEGPKWDIPSKVYSDSLQLYPGINIYAIQLKEKLERLGYQETKEEVSQTGEYKIELSSSPNDSTWSLFLHDFDYPLRHFSGFLVRFEVSDHVITQLKYQKSPKASFEEIALIELEPELITEFFENAREDRQVVKLENMPPNLLNAIIAVEDQRFLSHSGIDPKGILRALGSNLRAGTIVQGGSTLTQQLVKNFFLTQERSYMRKLNEALMAFIVESRYSKDDILETYANEIYLGQRGSAGIYGVSEAARFYFGKSLNTLSLSECATLAGIVRGPGVYSPFVNRERALRRRNFVLKKMLETQSILPHEYETALREGLKPRKIALTTNPAPYFVDTVKQELLTNYSEKVLNTQGLKIFTTLDPLLQRFANEAIRTTLASLETQFAHLKTQDQPLQAAFIALHPQTGFIYALAGGKNYNESQFNRITQAYRQPGSLFKPFVLLTALELEEGRKYKLTDRFVDEPFQWKYENQLWEPKDYEEEFKGEVTLREMIEQSINIPTARLAQEVGIKNVAKLIERLGVTSKIPVVPSLSLGSIEITPLEVATSELVF